MRLVLVAPWAVLLPLDALRMQALVLRGEVIAILALATGEDDLLSRHSELLLVESVRVGAPSVERPGSLGCFVVLSTPVRRAGVNC
jgi:hypothetical protein